MDGEVLRYPRRYYEIGIYNKILKGLRNALKNLLILIICMKKRTFLKKRI